MAVDASLQRLLAHLKLDSCCLRPLRRPWSVVFAPLWKVQPTLLHFCWETINNGLNMKLCEKYMSFGEVNRGVRLLHWRVQHVNEWNCVETGPSMVTLYLNHFKRSLPAVQVTRVVLCLDFFQLHNSFIQPASIPVFS